MSELNNNNEYKISKKNSKKVNKDFEKNNSKKVACVIVLIYAFIMIAITGALIYCNVNGIYLFKHMDEENENLIVANKDESKYLSTIEEKFFLNNIDLEEVFEQDGEFLNDYDWNDNEVYTYNASYYQISGLKNKDVEKKINDSIVETINKYKNKYMTEKFEHVNIYTYVTFNASNILSLEYSVNCEEKYNGDDYYFYSYATTYNLNDGSTLDIKDLFISNADIQNIIAQNVYTDMAREYFYEQQYLDDDFDFNGDLTKYDLSGIENRVASKVTEIKNALKKGKADVSLGYVYLTIYINEAEQENPYILSIPLENYIDQVVIYKKYIKKTSLFEDGDLKKDTYTFLIPRDNEGEIFEKIDIGKKNTLVYLTENINEDEFLTELDKKHFNRCVEKLKSEYFPSLKLDKDKGYVIEAFVSYFDERMAIGYSMLIMDIDFFKDNSIRLEREVESSFYEGVRSYIDYDKIEYEYYRLKEDTSGNFVLMDDDEEYYDEEDEEEDSNQISLPFEEITIPVEDNKTIDIIRDPKKDTNIITNSTTNTAVNTIDVIPSNSVSNSVTNQTVKIENITIGN